MFVDCYNIVQYTNYFLCAHADDEPGRRGMNGPAKVSDLQFTEKTEKQIFWLDVAMDDFLGVTVHQCIGQLKYVLQHRQTFVQNYKENQPLKPRIIPKALLCGDYLICDHFCPQSRSYQPCYPNSNPSHNPDA